MKNSTKITQYELKMFQESVSKAGFWRIEIGVVAVSIFVGIVLILMGDEYGLVSMGYTVIGWGVLFAIIYPIILKVLINSGSKNLNPLVNNDTVNNYEFNEDCMTDRTTNHNEVVSVTKIKYEQITKCVDYKDYLFLHISNAQAYIVDKGGMTSGNIDDLILFIQSKGIKYIVTK